MEHFNTWVASIAQPLSIIVYLIASAGAAVATWRTRERFHGINREKTPTSTIDNVFETADDLPASFSRTVGLAGAVFLTAFLWAIGLLILSGNPMLTTGTGSAESIEKFIFAGGTLFAPYAANQLSQILSTKKAAAADATPKLPVDLTQPLRPPSF